VNKTVRVNAYSGSLLIATMEVPIFTVQLPDRTQLFPSVPVVMPVTCGGKVDRLTATLPPLGACPLPLLQRLPTVKAGDTLTLDWSGAPMMTASY
jgi:hypothetical protein